MSRADTREPKTRRDPLIRAGWELATLKYGDYDGHDAIGKTWVVEQKPVQKMLQDMRTGVLQRQCRGIIEHSDFPILMVEGHWIRNPDGTLYNSGYTWDQAWDQLETLQDMGCRLQLTTSIAHTVERLFQLEAYYKKEKHDSALRMVAGSPYIVALSLIDGINEGKAKELEVMFPTLQSITIASLEDLETVKGIGEALAKRVWLFFRTNWRAQT